MSPVMNRANRLERYEEIAHGTAAPRYLLTKEIKCDFDPDSDLKNLWEIHDGLMSQEGETKATDGKQNLLELKAIMAKSTLENCTLCERMCQVNRNRGEKGACGVLNSRISSDFIHIGEEPEVIPSYTIFFSGCTFKCVFCQNWDISTHPDSGMTISPEDLATKIEDRDSIIGKQAERSKRLEGGFSFGRPHWAKNVNWVGGDPTSNLPFILRTLMNCRTRLPQIWNSNMYLTIESMKLLDGIVDLYLTDFKYGNDECAKRLSGIDRYIEVVSRNHKIASRQCDVIVRHLVLPNHIECCTRNILEWIAENTPSVVVNVMEQYRPQHRAHEFDEISRPLSGKEYAEALKIADELGLSLSR